MQPELRGELRLPKASVMARRRLRSALGVEDIGFDGEGRHAITNQELAETGALVALDAKRRKPTPNPNTNCGATCNTTKACKPQSNFDSCAPNTTPNCGCHLA